jgi:hypothetical protein
MLCNAFLLSCLKRVNKKKGKQKEKGIKKIVSSSIKNPNFANLFTSIRVKNIVSFGFVQYLPASELKIFVSKCSLMRKSGTL